MSGSVKFGDHDPSGIVRTSGVSSTPASGQESVGGTTAPADTAGRAPAAHDTAASRADSAVAESAEAGASQGR